MANFMGISSLGFVDLKQPPDPCHQLLGLPEYTGTTGHAEVVRVTFDPRAVSLEGILDWFWRLHDPTTLNRQGADVGTQYRSAIFVHSPEQRSSAEASRDAVAGSFGAPVVTEITDAAEFYTAETYHDDYYRQNREQGYCSNVIAPKLRKLGLDA